MENCQVVNNQSDCAAIIAQILLQEIFGMGESRPRQILRLPDAIIYSILMYF